MYEADDLSVATSPEYLARLNAPTPGTVNALRYFLNTSRAVCRVVHSIGSSTGGHVLAMRLGVPTAQSGAMCRFLCGEAFPRVIAVTGIVACHLFAADQSASFVNTAESSTRQFDVPSWVLLCEATWLRPSDRWGGVHLTAEEAGQHATRAGVGTLLLTHIWPAFDRDAAREQPARWFVKIRH